MAMERKRVPEKVMARSITFLFLKHYRPDTQLPKIVTSRKKTTISTAFTAKVPSIYNIQQTRGAAISLL
jgi:hypothetical protein